MKKIEILTGTLINGVPVQKGAVVEVTDRDYNTLITYNLAKPYQEPILKDEAEDKAEEEIKTIKKRERKNERGMQ